MHSLLHVRLSATASLLVRAGAFAALAALVGVGVGAATRAQAAPVEVTGRFLYEDRIWDGAGYTGEVQNLPIRHADVEVLAGGSSTVLATGSTDANGDYAISFDLGATTPLYVRCLSATDQSAEYHVSVVDDFVRTGGTVNLSGSTIHAITTSTHAVNPGNPATWSFGSFLIQDLTGAGVAQAFNILDQGIDSFDYLASSNALGQFPDAADFVVYGWDGTSGSSGSNYFWQGIYIASTSGDTDGWSDTVILHETGHWASDMFGRDDNPGGSHFIGDNFQDPRLSYGEGYATFFCALVREFRAPRDNGSGDPVDANVSLYADLAVPPLPPASGGLEFAYDFETGLFSSGTPIGQIGSANETNVTSAMWDLVDGAASPDGSPGVDDEPADEGGAFSWEVTEVYMTAQGDLEPLTIEDFYQGWFAQHGPGFLQSAVDSAFIGLAGMEFYADAFEPDDTPATATLVTPLSYGTALTGSVVINEVDLGPIDRVEIYNRGGSPVNLTGWKLIADRNGFASTTYTFPVFTIYPAALVIVQENGNPADNTADRVFTGANINWANADDGAVSLLDAGGTGVDFVRFDNVNGSDPSSTPPPAGTSWSGTLLSAPAPKTVARDQDGTDTNTAADFASRDASIAAPNFDDVPHHTIYPVGDQDVVRVDASAGDLVVFRAHSPHSAGRPVIELLDAGGNPSIPISNSYGNPSLAQVQLLAPSTQTLYARVRNTAPYTQFAPVDVLVFERPTAVTLAPPVALVAEPENTADIGDAVHLSWYNGGAYDNVEVRRDGGLVATLAGNATTFDDAANRGLHLYEVNGVLSGVDTDLAAYQVFAGVLECSTAENFESGSANLVLDAPWSLTGTIASSGAFSLHDSPGGNYGDGIDISAELIEPGEVLALPSLQFDHICITEATFDFGHVEISTDFGNNWIRLASYDMDDYPEWTDGVANTGDWKTEVVDLSAYVGEKVRVRFRLISDSFVTEDGWYLDNVLLSDPECETVSSIPEPAPEGGLAFLRPMVAFPNPFSNSLQLAITWWSGGSVDASGAGSGEGSVTVYDPSGRRVRTLYEGSPLPGLTLRWDGRDEAGRAVPTGVYWVRARHERGEMTERVLRVR